MPQSQKVMARFTSLDWQDIMAPLVASVKAPGQPEKVQSSPAPSQPLKYPKPLVTENSWGGTSETSVAEPLPGLVGFTSVVSTRVQPSPLSPHPPVCKKAMAETRGPLEVKDPPVERVCPPAFNRGVPKPQLLVKMTVWVSALTSASNRDMTEAPRILKDAIRTDA